MRIDQGRKVNFAGGAGCLSLLLLALVLANPVVGETASALDEGSADEVIDGELSRTIWMARRCR